MIKPFYFRGTKEEWDSLTREQQEATVANYRASTLKRKTCPACQGEGFVVDKQ